MPVKVRSLAEKRKASESPISPKRVKRENPTTTSKEVSSIQLNGPMPNVPYDSYISKGAMKLFSEVRGNISRIVFG